MDPKDHERLSSTVIVQRVKADAVEKYREWSLAINTACSEFPGFVELEVFEPIVGGNEFVIVVRFRTAAESQAWHSSEICKQLLEKAAPYLQERVVHNPSSVYSSWFGKTESSSTSRPATPPWKEALVVLLALYPTVMLLTLFVVEPLFSGWSMATSMYAGNLMSVALLTWVLMPRMSRWLSFWLSPRPENEPRASYLGLAVVLGGQWLAVALFYFFLKA